MSDHGGSDPIDLRRRGLLRELALVFLKLGTFSFGGPAAHIALMEDELVRRRGWLSHDEFLDMLGAVNVIPGPNSTEMAIHIGYRRAGWPGLLIAGCCFIMPAAIIVTGLAVAYVKYGSLAAFGGFLYGVKPIVVAVVVQALWNLARTAIKSRLLAGIMIIAGVLNFLGIHELVVLAGGALVTAFGESLRARPRMPGTWFSVVTSFFALSSRLTWGAAGSAVSMTDAAIQVKLNQLFFVFLKIGSILFGSGYVLLAFLRADMVERRHWLTETQLLDATAIGLITPGPVFTTATFIGYLLAGFPGAIVGTLGIFLPAFVFVGITAPFIPALRKSAITGRLLDGLNVTSLALMAVVTLQLARSAVIDWPTLLIALASGILLFKYKVNSIYLVALGAIIGLVMAFS
jgi:chromate transporter